jgi:hypothetical protein
MSIGKYSSKPDNYGFWIILVFLFMSADLLEAATYYSRATGLAFNSGTLWSTARDGATVAYPGATHSYVIQSGHSVNAVTLTIVQVTVESGGTFNMTGNRTLTLTNPFIIESGGTLSLATRTLTLGAGSIENSGNITGTTGEISRTTGTFTNTATGIVNMTGGAAYVMGSGNFVNDNTSANVNFGTGSLTVSGTGANQFIGGFTITGRFTVSKTAGSTTLTGNVNSGGITKSGASTLNMGSGTHTTTNTVILTAGIMNGGSSTINANFAGAGAWQGTGTVFVPQTSTVNFGAGVAQSLTASNPQTFYNLTFSNNGLKTNTNTTVTNILSMEGDATASVAPTYGASATLRYNSSNPRTAGPEWIGTFAATGGVIIDNTGAITTNGNKEFDLNSPLTINAGATLTPAAGNTFTFGGDFVNNTGTWTPSTGDVIITNTLDPQSIGSFSTSGVVSMTKASGIATFTGNINGGGLTIDGAGVLRLGFGLDHVITGDWTNTNGTLRGNTSTLHIGGNGSASPGDFRQNTSTIDFNGSGAQTIPAFTYYNLTTSTGGIKTLLGNTTVSNIFTIGPSTTLAAGANTLDILGDGTPLVVTGNFDKGTSTVNFSNALSTNIPALNYYNLDLVGGDRILANSGTIGIENIFSPGTAAFTVIGSTVNFNGSGPQTIPPFPFNSLVLSGSGEKTILTATTVSADTIEIQDGPTLALQGTAEIIITKP